MRQVPWMTVATGLFALSTTSCLDLVPGGTVDQGVADMSSMFATADLGTPDLGMPDDMSGGQRDLLPPPDLLPRPDLLPPPDLAPRTWPPLTMLRFANAVTYSAGTNPHAVVAADFNHDGKIDVAVANEGSNNVSVFRGNGDGTFQAAVPYAVGMTPRGMALGDLNGDHNPDLVVTNEGSDNGSVLLGNADGTFQPARTFSPTKPDGVTVGDFNGDGMLDVAAVGYGSGHVDIFLGDGKGGLLSVGTPVPGGDTLGKGAALDCNGDGKVDLAITSGSGLGWDSVGALIGNGDGTFRAGPTFYNYGGGTGNHGIVTLDLNGDKKVDVILPNNASDSVTILLGKGDCSFTKGVNIPTGNNSVPFGVAVGDLNLDGKIDLITANSGNDTVGIALGNGDGSFQSIISQSAGVTSKPYEVAVADFDGDGRPDIVSADFGSGNVSVLLNASTP